MMKGIRHIMLYVLVMITVVICNSSEAAANVTTGSPGNHTQVTTGSPGNHTQVTTGSQGNHTQVTTGSQGNHTQAATTGSRPNNTEATGRSGIPTQATSSQTYSPKNLPTIYPSHVPNFGHGNVSLRVPLQIYVEATYRKELGNTTSSLYLRYTKDFNRSLTELYKNITGFQGINITGFFKGSIGCNFELLWTPPDSTQIDTTGLFADISAVPYKDVSFHVDNNTFSINVSKTNAAIEKGSFYKTLGDACRKLNLCTYDTECVVDKKQLVCTHKCNVNNICSKNGECYVNKDGVVKCRCRKDSMYLYNGDTCNETFLVFFSSRNTAIIGGCAGAVIAFLLLILIYLGARWRRKRTTKSTKNNLSDPREIQRDNHNIENVPLDGVGKANPAYRPDESYRYGYDNHYSDDRPSTGNLYEEDLAYNEGRYFRVLKDPESRSKAFVYQPTNISIPDHRTSTASKFDDLDSKPPSFYMRPEIEQRPFHDLVDTEHPYSIKRPQISRSAVSSNGYR